MSDEETTLDMSQLNRFMKILSENTSEARVGILGSKNARKDGDSNATIGAKHEFGSEGMPMRSFLRVPISENLQFGLVNSQAFDIEVMKEVMAEGTVIPWLKRVALVAEAIVLEAFHTGGMGKWRPSNMTYKKNKMTLVETIQLRDSITSEVHE